MLCLSRCTIFHKDGDGPGPVNRVLPTIVESGISGITVIADLPSIKSKKSQIGRYILTKSSIEKNSTHNLLIINLLLLIYNERARHLHIRSYFFSI